MSVEEPAKKKGPSFFKRIGQTTTYAADKYGRVLYVRGGKEIKRRSDIFKAQLIAGAKKGLVRTINRTKPASRRKARKRRRR